MALEIRNQEWPFANWARAYPILADATQRDVTNTFTLPKSFLVEMYIAINAGVDVDPSQFFVLSVGSFASGYSVVIGYNAESGPVPVASALVARAAQVKRNTPYRLSGLGSFLDAVGHIVIGTLDDIDQQPAGQWTFNLAGSQLEQDAICPSIRNVSSLQVQNGTQLSPLIYGDVILQAGTNFRLTPILTDGEPTVIVFDAIDGDGLNDICICVDNSLDTCIQTINYIGPTPDGNFSLLGNDCLQVVGIDNGVQLEDICSEPCCGCAELEVVTGALQQLGSQASTLGEFQSNLTAAVAQLQNTVNGSTFGDRSCCPGS